MSQPAYAPHNLPASLTPLIGRADEQRQVLDLLRGPTYRLVSLVGPGGIGKTRLALECAWALAHEGARRFADGVYLVALADIPASELLSDLLATAIAEALGLSFSGSDTPAAQLRHYLRGRSMLLLLDNFEHFTAAAPFLAGLLQDAPRLSLMVTTREALRMRGEWCMTLTGLRFPDRQPLAERSGAGAAEQLAAGQLAGYAALELFTQTARMYDASFALTPENAPAAIQICQTVDGLPLAIELATSWLRTLSCAEVAAELARGLDILSSSAGDLSPRQRSLRALFSSSWDLLGPAEQLALGRLAIFRGAFTREAAAAVTEISLPVLAALVDKSLVRRRAGPGDQPSHYELLELVRQYAAEQLQQAGETGLMAERHAAYYAGRLAAHTPTLRGADQQAALAAIAEEIGQIRAAWQWACQAASQALIARAADGLFHFYDMHSLFSEGAAAFEAACAALAAGPTDLATRRTWAHALARQGWFVFHLGHQREAQALLEQAITAQRELGARADLIFSLNYQGAVCSYLGEYAATEALCREALALAQELDDRYGQAIASNVLGQAAYDQGQYTVAQSWSQQSLAIEQQLGNRWSMTYSFTNLGKVAFITGAYAEARWCFEESMQFRQALGDTRGVAVCLNRLGETAVALSALDEARERYDESLRLFRSIGSQWGVAATLIHRAHLALAQSNESDARPMLREALELAIELESQPQIVTIIATCAPLVRRSGDRAWADELDQLLADAPNTLPPYQPPARRLVRWLAEPPAPPAPPARPGPATPPPTPEAAPRATAAENPAGLTAREIDVLRLVAQGLTDAQVADKLIVSRRTVSTHLSAIYGKLQVNSRSAATRFAIESGLG
jgi:predicted ATPase/DNA-binding CsgD family transcriptional regulator